MILHSLFLVLLAGTAADAYNYLIYSPMFAHSHTNFVGKLADTLTDAGHNVTLLSPLVNHRLRGKFNVQSTKDIITHDVDQYLIDLEDHIDESDVGDFWTKYANVFNQGEIMNSFIDLLNHHCELVSLNEKTKAELKSRKFDVMLFEPLNFCGYLVRDYLKIKTFIFTTTFPFDPFASEFSGEPVPPTAVPGLQSVNGDNMSLLERAWNAFEMTYGLRGFYNDVPENLYKNFGIKPFKAADVVKEASFIFVNSNPLLDFPRPTLPKTVHIGGLSVDLKKLRSQKLDAEFDKVLNKRPKTVLMSFGTVVLSSFMPDHYKQNLLKVFASMPDVTFIWKYETDDLDWASGAKNVHFSKWVPQTALLADPRLTAFITHGGLSSSIEISYTGKPALMIPIFADQMRNARMVSRHGGATVLSKSELGNYEAVRDALNEVLHNGAYNLKAQSLAKKLENQPIKPKENVIKYAEFAAMFPDLTSLNFAGGELSTTQYYLIDFSLLLLSLFILLLFVVYRLVKIALSVVQNKKEKTS